MIKTLVLTAFLVVLPCMQPAQAKVAVPQNPFLGAQYKCTPSNLSLTYIRRSGLEDGLHFQGSFETPTPGYSFEFSGLTTEDDGVHTTLSLQGPDGMVVQVIDKLVIDTIIPLEKPPTAVYVDMKDPVKWGFERITCNIVG